MNSHVMFPSSQWTMIWYVLHINSIFKYPILLSHLYIFLPIPFCKTPFPAYHYLNEVKQSLLILFYLLSSWKLELGTSQCLNDSCFMIILGTDRYDWLTNVYPGYSALRLTKGTSHSSL